MVQSGLVADRRWRTPFSHVCMKYCTSRSKHLLNTFPCLNLGSIMPEGILSQCSSQFLLDGLEGRELFGEWRGSVERCTGQGGRKALKGMLKIVPPTPSSLSQGLESPWGAQTHQHYSSLVRNTTFSRAPAAILENRGMGQYRLTLSVGHRQKV